MAAPTLKCLPTDPTEYRVGCVGGGQLGRMMALEAHRLNVTMRFLDPAGPSSPAALAAGRDNVIEGNLDDDARLRELAEGCDVLTVEIEHVGVKTLAKLEEEGVNVQPSSRVIGIIQDKLTQKVRLRGAVAPSYGKGYYLVTMNPLINSIFAPLLPSPVDPIGCA